MGGAAWAGSGRAFPGIDEPDPGGREVGGAAGGKGEFVDVGRGGDEGLAD